MFQSSRTNLSTDNPVGFLSNPLTIFSILRIWSPGGGGSEGCDIGELGDLDDGLWGDECGLLSFRGRTASKADPADPGVLGGDRLEGGGGDDNGFGDGYGEKRFDDDDDEPVEFFIKSGFNDGGGNPGYPPVRSGWPIPAADNPAKWDRSKFCWRLRPAAAGPNGDDPPYDVGGVAGDKLVAGGLSPGGSKLDNGECGYNDGYKYGNSGGPNGGPCDRWGGIFNSSLSLSPSSFLEAETSSLSPNTPYWLYSQLRSGLRSGEFPLDPTTSNLSSSSLDMPDKWWWSPSRRWMLRLSGLLASGWPIPINLFTQDTKWAKSSKKEEKTKKRGKFASCACVYCPLL